METEAETHSRALDWAPKVQLKNENMSEEVKTMMVHPLKQFIWAIGSSPTPARQGRSHHRTKLDLLNVVYNDWGRLQGHWQWPRIYPYFLSWLFRNPFSLVDTFLSLDIVGRALVLSQSNVPYPLWGVDGERRREEGGGNERRGGSGNWDWYVKWKKIVHFLFRKKN